MRWRPLRVGALLLAFWFLGSLAITAIIFLEAMGSRAALYAYSAWALAFAFGTYVAFSFGLNSTSVEVDRGELVCRTSPLAWGWTGANTRIAARDVTELVVESYMRMGFLGPGGRLYRVSARTPDGRTIPIVASAMIGKGDRADAEDLARRIEAMLR